MHASDRAVLRSEEGGNFLVNLQEARHQSLGEKYWMGTKPKIYPKTKPNIFEFYLNSISRIS